MKKILFLVAGGGFQWESLTLAEQLCDQWSCKFIVPESSVYTGSALLNTIGNRNYITIPEFSSRADKKKLSIAKNFWRAVKSLRDEFKKEPPDAAICLGSSMSLPIALVCLLRKVPIIFIESITRTDSLSSTGKLLLSLHLIDHFYVQWPEQEKLHPQARYKGTVL